MESSEQAVGLDRSVLVVADEAVLEEIRGLLGDALAVVEAQTPSRGLELLEERDGINVVIADAGQASTQFLVSVQERQPGTRRVAIIDNGQTATLAAMINDACIDYLAVKPLDNAFANKIQELANEAYEESLEADDAERLRAELAELAQSQHELQRQLDETRRALRSSDAELAQVTRELEVLSFRDPLTGLYNHRAFQERLHEEISRAKRYEQPMSLILCDVDNFAAINSRLGYQIGDETLRRLATSVLSAHGDSPGRHSDVVARYAGEVFALILPETGISGAVTKAERMRELAQALPRVRDIALSVSMGVASYPEDGQSAEDIVAAAQRALKLAKQTGKNQVVASADADDVEEEEESDTGRLKRPLLGSGPPMFPSYHQRIAEIVAALEHDQAVAALYVDLSRLRRVEQEFGLAHHAAIFGRAGALLHQLQGTKLRRDDLICRTEVDDAFVCFLSPARHKNSGSTIDLSAIARRVELILDAGLADELAQLGTDRQRITVGFSRVLNNPLMRPERLIARLIDEARHSAAMLREHTVHRDKSQLQELILHRQLRTVFQPIVHLESGATFGFESLTRGPEGSRLEMPLELFGIADEVDLTFELDRACFRGALRTAVGLEPVHRLFVNVLPLSFYDASFIEDEVARLLEEADLTPANLVFEITEKLAIENFSAFRRALGRYTAMGFGVAIDDVGTRHSNLETVMSLRPHFIKISDILTRGVSGSTVKREMLRSLGRIAEAIDAVIVAEGIESADDLAVVSDLGVRYGQGFFLARPGPPFPRVSGPVKDTVCALASSRRSPIPEPPIDYDYDEDGERREGASAPPTGVHAAVVKRIKDAPGHEAAKSMLDRLEALRQGEAPPHEPPQPELPRRATTRSDTGEHTAVTVRPLAWSPIREEELGVEVDQVAPSSSLLKGLRKESSSPTNNQAPSGEGEGPQGS